MLKKVAAWLTSAIGFPLFVKKAEGFDNIPSKGVILAPNHTSYLDIWIVETGVLFKRRRWVRFFAKGELVHDPYFKILTCVYGNKVNMPILLKHQNSGDIALSAAAKALKKGHIICIFPEGTRSLTGKLQKGKTGMVRLALQSHCPIVPIGINGTYGLMPPGKKFPTIKRKVRIKVGKPIYLDKYYKRRVSKKTLRQITDSIMGKITKLSMERSTGKKNAYSTTCCSPVF